MTPAQTQEIDALIDRIAELLEGGATMQDEVLTARKVGDVYIVKDVDPDFREIIDIPYPTARKAAEAFGMTLTPTQLRQAIEATGRSV